MQVFACQLSRTCKKIVKINAACSKAKPQDGLNLDFASTLRFEGSYFLPLVILDRISNTLSCILRAAVHACERLTRVKSIGTLLTSRPL